MSIKDDRRKAYASDFGIDEERIKRLDDFLFRQLFDIAETEEEVDQQFEEMKSESKIQEIYNELQNYNSYEIVFYLISTVGATFDQEIRFNLLHGRADRLMRRVESGGLTEKAEHLYITLVQKLTLAMAREIL